MWYPYKCAIIRNHTVFGLSAQTLDDTVLTITSRPPCRAQFRHSSAAPLFICFQSISDCTSPRSSLALAGLLLSRRHFTDTPLETSDLISGQEVKGFKFSL